MNTKFSMVDKLLLALAGHERDTYISRIEAGVCPREGFSRTLYLQKRLVLSERRLLKDFISAKAVGFVREKASQGLYISKSGWFCP
jgi:hypothetical protein